MWTSINGVALWQLLHADREKDEGEQKKRGT
jgi:hypothetical protein